MNLPAGSVGGHPQHQRLRHHLQLWKIGCALLKIEAFSELSNWRHWLLGIAHDFHLEFDCNPTLFMILAWLYHVAASRSSAYTLCSYVIFRICSACRVAAWFVSPVLVIFRFILAAAGC